MKNREIRERYQIILDRIYHAMPRVGNSITSACLGLFLGVTASAIAGVNGTSTWGDTGTLPVLSA